ALDTGREPPWDKLRNALDEPLEARERRGLARGSGSAPPDEEDSGDWLLGYVVGADAERGELTLALDEEVEKLLEQRALTLPRSATLVYKASGDLAQIRRLKFGLELLEQGYGQNPRLADFIFEAGKARLPDPATRVWLDRDELLQPRLNEGQRAAVEGALSAPDLFLIQGPPGTGKTTVIAEICYQNALRGQRTLIASQSNLAVDNALSRLVHHPRIRALRRGRADRVEVEGASFLEDRVVTTWLAKTAESCEHDLAERRDRIRKFDGLLQNRPRLEALAVALDRYQSERPKHAAALAALESQVAPLQQHAEQVARGLARRRDARDYLQGLQDSLAAAGEVSAPSAGVRLPVLDHPAVQELRAQLAELASALAAWEPVVAGRGAAPADGQTAPRQAEMAAAQGSLTGDDPPATLDAVLRAAAAGRQHAKTTLARLADLRAGLEALGQLAQACFDARAELERLSAEQERLSASERTFSERRVALGAERDALQAKVAELASFDAAKIPVGAALRRWVEWLAEAGGGSGEPPPEFASLLGREIWSAASERAQLHRLSALALEVRTARTEARRLADLAVRLAGLLDELVPELAAQPAAAAGRRAAGLLPGPTTRRGGRSSAHWKHTALSSLAAFDVHGGLHPAAGAEAALSALEQQLAQVRQRPPWLAGVLGAGARRQQLLADWARRLRAAAADFVSRRADLEALARHKSARLKDRAEASAPALQAAVAQVAEAFGPQAEQRLVFVQTELQAVTETQPAVTARLAELDQALAAAGTGQSRREMDLLAGRDALGDSPRMRPFQNLLRQAAAGRRPPDDWVQAWETALADFDTAVQGLETQVQRLDPQAAVAALIADVSQELARLEQNAGQVRQSRHTVERDLQAAREGLEALDERHARELAWWQTTVGALPPRLLPPVLRDTPTASPAYVQAMLAASAAWDADLQQEQAYLARAEKLVTDWVQRLRAADKRDADDLRQIYIDNANVIGITCVQAGAYQFSRQYRNFDCVIVDEVSKATPPELLLPMLKGARVVLVGDHKQLPPMIGPDTLTDLAAELGVPHGELDHLERSLFKELFEAAPPELRAMLTEQYRMHPQIMNAINQFYADQLTCGLPDPERQRAHGFDLPWLRPDNHLLWINTPSEGPFAEQKVGTTFLNTGEVDVVLRLVKELDAAWAPQVAGGQPPKEVGLITFYGAQVRELKARLIERAGQFNNLRLRVGTVDRFQGMERAVIIVSLVRNNPHGAVGFARKPERVNVAFSRAQELLMIVGSREQFTERARNDAPGAAATGAIYSRVAQMVQSARGLRRTSDVSHAYKR
ncbi:MAG: AAA family ATPase, partial [Anaerolineales bacterium]|nr:AAA family ATPase [Anaerolineales bacterium]